MKTTTKSAKNIQENLIIFTHIPKTAGTSLRHILMQQYGKNAVFMFYDDPSVTTKNAEELLDELRGYFQDVTEIKEPTFNNLVKLRAISGHKAFGIHDLLPVSNFHYITLLREPIERVISFYYHIYGRREKALSIEYLISSKASVEFDNLQVRMLSGVGWEVPYGHCSYSMLEQAKHNLLHYYTFGIQDRFAESLETFSKNLGWSKIQIVTENVGKNKKTSSEISQQTLSLIAENNKFDLELYHFAKQLFEERTKIQTLKIFTNSSERKHSKQDDESCVPIGLVQVLQKPLKPRYESALSETKKELQQLPSQVQQTNPNELSATGSQNQLTIINIQDVELFPAANPELLWGGTINARRLGTNVNASNILIWGWILGKQSPAVKVELIRDGEAIREIPVNHYRPDVAGIFPGVPLAANSGYATEWEVTGTLPEYEMVIQAILADETRLKLGLVRLQEVVYQLPLGNQKKKYRMKWFFAINEGSGNFKNYSQMIKVAVYTAQQNTSLEPYCIYDGEDNELTSWLKKHGVKIIYHRTPHYDKIKTEYPLSLTIASGAFLRIEIPKLLEINEIQDEYVFYTDCDVMFFDDVVDYLQGLTCEYLAATPEHDPNNWEYFNSGVLYMNVKNLQKIQKEFDEFIDQNLDEILKRAYDQGAYNLFFKDKWDRLDIQLNWKSYWNFNREAKIIHFHGPKPTQAKQLRSQKAPAAYIKFANDFYWLHTEIWQFTYQKLEELDAGILVKALEDIEHGKISQVHEEQVLDILEVFKFTATSREVLLGFSIDVPKPNTKVDPSSMIIGGWVLGKKSRVTGVELICEEQVIQKAPVNGSRPDVAKVFPEMPMATNSGFTATVKLIGMPSEGKLLLQAIFEDESCVPLGVVRFLQKPLNPRYESALSETNKELQQLQSQVQEIAVDVEQSQTQLDQIEADMKVKAIARPDRS